MTEGSSGVRGSALERSRQRRARKQQAVAAGTTGRNLHFNRIDEIGMLITVPSLGETL